MFQQIIEGLEPYLTAGFLDDISDASDIGPDAFSVRAGDAVLLVNCKDADIEVAFGDNRGAVLSGVTPSQAVRFVIQALGRGDFTVPDVILSRFQVRPFPAKFEKAVLAPIGITQSDRGDFHAVYKDVRSRYYIHQDECRISLRLYKELFDMNSESEVLKLPSLFQSDVPPVLVKNPQMVSEDTAEAQVASFPILSYLQAAATGVPVRIQSATIPGSGYCSMGDTAYESSELGKYLLDLATEWESILSGEAVPAPEPAKFTGVKVGMLRSSDLRAELSLTFSADWAGGVASKNGTFIDERRILVPKGEARAIVEMLDNDLGSSDPEVVQKLFSKVKDQPSVAPETVAPVKAVSVTSSVRATVSEDIRKPMVTSSAHKQPVPLKMFALQHSVPEWMLGCSRFAVLSVKQ